MPARKFHKTWDRADRWGFVVLTPGQLPARVEAGAYARAVAGLEATGHFEEAARAWEAGLAESPSEPLYLFGLGNARYALGDKPAARAAWERLVWLRPDDPSGLNNLAVVLGEFECVERAQALARRAMEVLPEGDPAADEISHTLSTLSASPVRPDAAHCQPPRY